MLSGAVSAARRTASVVRTAGGWLSHPAVNPALRQCRRHAGRIYGLYEGVGIGDGQKTDKAGNLFSSGGAGPGIIRITSPEGKLLGTINLPIYGGEPKRQICATNEAFGGADGKTLFMAGCDAVYTIQLKSPGIVPANNVNK